MHAGTRITGRLRQRFLRAALHQDVTHYDTQLTSADVVTGLSADCAAVQAAISEEVRRPPHPMPEASKRVSKLLPVALPMQQLMLGEMYNSSPQLNRWQKLHTRNLCSTRSSCWD